MAEDKVTENDREVEKDRYNDLGHRVIEVVKCDISLIQCPFRLEMSFSICSITDGL